MANGAPSDHGAGPEQAPPAAAAAIAAAAAAKSAGSPSGRRAPREINWLNLWPIAFAPLIPAVALATRKSPQLRTPLVGAISVGTLIFAHGFAMDASVSSKDG
uniref:Uncharacterized protein n=1 Tax=Prasinoderma coloniale TaxID=156133 RepID=A0A7R9TZT3_9VIRI|mmetsp:Transcript_9172/g.37581  ORF Transcript_9172/g.37581 Transcript_9172/m.37581 type:complete len:103 (+) Transcript_9172:147-455(+)